MNRTFKTVALPILVVFVLVYVAQSMFHFGGLEHADEEGGLGHARAGREHTEGRRRRCSR